MKYRRRLWTHDETAQRIGVLIRTLDIPPSELAERLGASPQAVRRWAAGETIPHNKMQHKIEILEGRLRTAGRLQ